MATKKATTEAVEVAEEKIEKAAEEPAATTEPTTPEQPQEPEVEAPKDEWDEEVEVMVPRRHKGDDQYYYVCVNDRRFEIPANGKRQKMPRPIAEILQSSIDAEYAAEEFAEQMTQKAMENARSMM